MVIANSDLDSGGLSDGVAVYASIIDDQGNCISEVFNVEDYAGGGFTTNDQAVVSMKIGTKAVDLILMDIRDL